MHKRLYLKISLSIISLIIKRINNYNLYLIFHNIAKLDKELMNLPDYVNIVHKICFSLRIRFPMIIIPKYANLATISTLIVLVVLI